MTNASACPTPNSILSLFTYLSVQQSRYSRSVWVAAAVIHSNHLHFPSNDACDEGQHERDDRADDAHDHPHDECPRTLLPESPQEPDRMSVGLPEGLWACLRLVLRFEVGGWVGLECWIV